MALGKCAQRFARASIKDTSSGNDHRSLGCDHRTHRRKQIPVGWGRRPKLDDRALEKLGRIIKGGSLHVLRQGKSGRSAQQGISQGMYSTWERSD